MSPYMQDRYLRAEAANDNGFVGLPFFAAAVVSGVTRWPYLDSVFGLGLGRGLHSASLRKLLSLGSGETRRGTSVYGTLLWHNVRAGAIADTGAGRRQRRRSAQSDAEQPRGDLPRIENSLHVPLRQRDDGYVASIRVVPIQSGPI